VLLPFLATLASASPFYVETPTGTDRDAARVTESGVTEAGESPRIVRRFVDGAGWRFFVRIEGFQDEADATAVAGKLAAATHADFAVFESEGDHAVRLAVVEAGSAPATEKPTPSDAAPILFDVLQAHGTTPSTLQQIHTGPMRFVYRRTLPGDRIAETSWLTAGGDVRVDVAPFKGAVRSSSTIVSSEGAWLSVDGGAWTKQDQEKSRTVLAQLAPDEVIPLVLALGTALPSRREFERMTVVQDGASDEDLLVLRFEGDAAAGPVELAVSPEDHLIRRARFGDSGAIEHTFDDYRTVGDLRVPFRITTLRAETDEPDVVEVVAFDPAPRIPAGVFDVE